MKNSKLLVLLFMIVAITQLATPIYMAWRWEDILQNGQRFYWSTAPVDPYDAFKGRYIDLQFKNTTGPIKDNVALDYGQPAYALIEETSDGKAFIREVSAKPPVESPYVKVRITYVEGNTAHVSLPFKRYYLPENMASAAENAYQQSAGKTGLAAVRLKGGLAVIEQLYIGDKTLDEFLRSGH